MTYVISVCSGCGVMCYVKFNLMSMKTKVIKVPVQESDNVTMYEAMLHKVLSPGDLNAI